MADARSIGYRKLPFFVMHKEDVNSRWLWAIFLIACTFLVERTFNLYKIYATANCNLQEEEDTVRHPYRWKLKFIINYIKHNKLTALRLCATCITFNEVCSHAKCNSNGVNGTMLTYTWWETAASIDTRTQTQTQKHTSSSVHIFTFILYCVHRCT